MATIADGRTIPFDWYSDPAVLRLERERIFRRTWQYAGRADQVARAGLVLHRATWPASRSSSSATTQDGLRAFLNVCRHRGSLVCEGAGQARDAPVPVPRLDVRPRRLVCARRRAPSREPGFDTGEPRARARWRSTRGARSSSSTRTPTPSRSRDTLGELPGARRRRRASTSTYSASSSAPNRSSSRAQLEPRAERTPRVLPLCGCPPGFSRGHGRLSPDTYLLEMDGGS